MIKRGETDESLSVPGKVVWIITSGAERNRVQGVGVQFDKKCGQVRDWIEQTLVWIIEADQPADTM
jgi:Tfp pilus assembly protein PilZ